VLSLHHLGPWSAYQTQNTAYILTFSINISSVRASNAHFGAIYIKRAAAEVSSPTLKRRVKCYVCIMQQHTAQASPGRAQDAVGRVLLQGAIVAGIIAHVDAGTRRTMRAVSRGLRAAIDTSRETLLFTSAGGDPGSAAPALRHVASSWQRWGGVRTMELSCLGSACLGPALALLDGAAR
jgi:hypothetical protein